MSAKGGPILYALVVFIVLLGSLLVLQGLHGSHAAALLRTPAREIGLAPAPQALNLPEDFRIIQDRALFYATRKFYQPPAATSPTMLSRLSSYQLLGTLVIPRRSPVAFLRNGPTGKTTKLSPGDHFDGWTVKAIQSGQVVLGYEGHRDTLRTMLPFAEATPAQGSGIVRVSITRTAPSH